MPKFNVKLVHTETGQREDKIVDARDPDAADKQARAEAGGPVHVLRIKLVRNAELV